MRLQITAVDMHGRRARTFADVEWIACKLKDVEAMSAFYPKAFKEIEVLTDQRMTRFAEEQLHLVEEQNG